MAKSPYNIEPDATFKQAAVAALRTQVDELIKNLPGTREGNDIEALHDMRVASRRLRAAMSVFGQAFPEKPFKALGREVSRVTDALGAVRDADVLIEYMEAAEQSVPPLEKVGLDAFVDYVKNERDRERVALVKELNRLEHSHFSEDFAAMLGDHTDRNPNG